MPQLNRKTHRRRELTHHETFALRTGLIGPGQRVRKMTDDEAREYWSDPAIREPVMAEHAEHHANGWPGRPWAWWRLEAGEDRPDVLAPPWAEAARLLELDQLDADERERLPRLIRVELVTRRARAGMDPRHWLETLQALADKLGVDAAGDEPSPVDDDDADEERGSDEL